MPDVAALTNRTDDEYEYEYDDEEVEHFYITLDLTTQVPPTLGHGKSAKGAKAARRSGKGDPSTREAIPDVSAAAENASPSPSSDPERMQILNLHDDNPLISYNNTLYSCHWATDVGTSLFLTSPESDNDIQAVLRSTPSFDLLGMSSARLIAVPATLTPRAPAPRPPMTVSVADDDTFTTVEGDVIDRTGSRLRITLPAAASAAKVAQARFLERLSDIKAQKGEKDAVPATSIKTWKQPVGWEAQRDECIARETAASERNKLEAKVRLSRLSGRAIDAAPALRNEPSLDAQTEAEGETLDAEDVEDECEQEQGGLQFVNNDMMTMTGQKRRARGGTRGGAPSGKRLRQSLGLPEARRDKRSVGRPRRIRIDPDVAGEMDAEPGASATPATEAEAEDDVVDGEREIVEE